MNQTTSTSAMDPNSVKRVISIKAPPDLVWRVFTEKLSTWWPLATHKLGASQAVDAIMEPRVGGRWYERGDDGSECEWGRVLSWEPPARLVLSWEISADWRPDPTIKTEVEVRFIADGQDTTRVELEHRGLAYYGDRRDEMREILGSGGGWTGLLAAFATRAGQPDLGRAAGRQP